ncbi:hypothetical protein GCM10028805_15580 [Spirosoma harenae]
MKTFYQLCILLLFSLISCRSSEPDPEPAALVSGDYSAVVALNTGLVYPINGKSFSLKIQRVSKDTVQVAIQSEPNYGFSPGQNLTYAKAFVGSSTIPVAKQLKGGSYRYTVYLTPNAVNNPSSLDNVLLFYQHNGHSYIDYHYRPEGTNPEWEGEEITRLQQY